MKRTSIAVAISALLFASGAHAQLYGSVDVSSVKGSERHSALGVAAGYQFSRGFALEMGYTDLSLLSEDLTQVRTQIGPKLFQTDSSSTRNEGESIHIKARLSVPVTQSLSVFGTAAAHRLHVDELQTFQTLVVDETPPAKLVSNITTRVATRKRDTVPGYGVGIAWQPNKHFSLSLSGERINLQDETLLGVGHLTKTSITTRLAF